MKEVLIKLICIVLVFLTATVLAPVAINLIVWILQPDYVRCDGGGNA